MGLYTPNKNPNEAFVMVSGVVLAGILLGFFAHKYFLVVALLFWIQYTAVLSFMQFKRQSKHRFYGITESLLVPQFRFFVFEVLAFVGLFAVVIYDSLMVGTSTLLVWWVFALNFFVYYARKD